MAANVRPLSQPDDSASTGATRLGRSRASRTEVDYRRLHRGTLAKERLPSQSTEKSNDDQESRMETILKAIAGVHDSVDERFALLHGAIVQQQVSGIIRQQVTAIVQQQVTIRT